MSAYLAYSYQHRKLAGCTHSVGTNRWDFISGFSGGYVQHFETGWSASPFITSPETQSTLTHLSTRNFNISYVPLLTVWRTNSGGCWLALKSLQTRLYIVSSKIHLLQENICSNLHEKNLTASQLAAITWVISQVYLELRLIFFNKKCPF